MLIETLDSAKVADLLKSNQVVTFDSELLLHEACDVLATNKISSAPVYDREQGAFIGMLDYRDLVAHVLIVLHKIPAPPRSLDADWGPGNVSVKMITNLSSRDPLVTIQDTASLTDAINEFISKKCHRLVVLDSNSPPNCVGILSQSRVVQYVVDRFSKFSKSEDRNKWEQGKKSLLDWGIIQKEVISLHAEDSVLDAMYQMHQHQVSSIAITESSPTQEILSDKRGWSKLMQPAGKFFIATRKKQALESSDGATKMPLFMVSRDTSLIDALAKMVATKSHRVWVVDAALATPSNPYPIVGLVGLSSTLDCLLK